MADRTPTLVLLLLLLVSTTTSCTTIATSGAREPSFQRMTETFEPDDIIELKTGRRISFEELMNALEDVRVIHVGETHTSKEDHRIQQLIAEGLHSLNPLLVLALEMFPRESQTTIDRFSAGLISESTFLKEVRWDDVWGHPFELYRDLLTWAREKRLEIIGLNAPPDVVRKISQGGLASLSPDDRSRVAEDFDFRNPDHRRYVHAQYAQHLRGNIRDFESFYAAQLAWEETMAETLAQKLASLHPDEQVLVVLGKGHMTHRYGVPERTLARIPHTYKTVLPLPVNHVNGTKDPTMADYVWVTQRMEPFHRGRLGVVVRPSTSEGGLEILSVLPDSPAERADIRKGDKLYQIDGRRIATIEELREALAGELPAHRMKLMRGNGDVSVTVELSP